MNARPNGEVLEEEEYSSGESAYDHGRSDYRSLLPAEKQEHIKELWRICFLKSSGASSIVRVFNIMHEKIVLYGTTRNLNRNLEDMEKMIIE